MSSISAEKLRREIQIILKDADLNTLSSKKVRQMLEAIFKCDFTERKKEIDDILMSEITTRDTAPSARGHSDIDNQVESSDQDESSSSQTVPMSHQTSTKSDEELAMEIHQQENRPSLRRPVVSLLSLTHRQTMHE